MRRALPAVAALALVGCGSSSLPPPAAEPAVSPPAHVRPTGRVVRVGSFPEGLVADPATGLVAVGLRNPDELALVSARSGRVVRRVRLPESPRHLALEAAGGPVLVPSERAGALVRVALPSGRVESVTPVGRFPHDVAASGARVLVGNEMADSVSILAGARRVATLSAPHQPGGVAPLPGGLAVVAAVGARVLAIYGLDPPRLVTKANAGVGPTHVASALGRLFVVDTQGDAILAFRMRPRFELNGRANAPGAPYGIAADERRRRLYVTLTARNQLIEYALGGPAPRWIATYPVVRQPNSVTVDPRSGRVFVASRTEGTLELIDPSR